MRCPECGCDNAEDAAFCSVCMRVLLDAPSPVEPLEADVTAPAVDTVPSASVLDPHLDAPARDEDADVLQRNWARRVAEAGDETAAQQLHELELESALLEKRRKEAGRRMLVYSLVGAGALALFLRTLTYAYGWLNSTAAAPAGAPDAQLTPLIVRGASLGLALVLSAAILSFSAARATGGKKWGVLATLVLSALEVVAIGPFVAAIGTASALLRAQGTGAVIAIVGTLILGLACAAVGASE